jgi:hypothetical protein
MVETWEMTATDSPPPPKKKKKRRKKKTENRKQKTENRKQKTDPPISTIPEIPLPGGWWGVEAMQQWR